VEPGVGEVPAGGGVLVDGSGEVVAGGGELGAGSGVVLGLLIEPGVASVPEPVESVELLPEPVVPFIVVPEPLVLVSPGLLSGAVLLLPPIVPGCVVPGCAPVWPLWLPVSAEPLPVL
jgi:hypothetical protein